MRFLIDILLTAIAGVYYQVTRPMRLAPARSLAKHPRRRP
jgi:hypothetical protein